MEGTGKERLPELTLVDFDINRSAVDFALGRVLENSYLNSDRTSNVRMLIGGDPDLDHWNFTVLHRIVLGLCPESSASLTQQLHHNHSLINSPDRDGRTPLHWAAKRGDVEQVILLLKWRADPNLADKWLMRPLHEAATGETVDCVRELIDAGADIETRNTRGRTPMQFALQGAGEKVSIIQMLVQFGADINSRADYGSTPLMLAISGLLDAKLENVTAAVELGADIDAQDDNGDSVAMIAAIKNGFQMMEYLVGKGVLLSTRNHKGQTILHLAALYCDVNVIKLLTTANLQGVDVGAKDCNGDTAEDCFKKYRDYWYLGKRLPIEDERAALAALLTSARDGSSIDDGRFDESTDEEEDEWEDTDEEPDHDVDEHEGKDDEGDQGDEGDLEEDQA